MLVIINPVATKMSDRLKSLVVYALQGRYEVTTVDTEAKGHAIELCREAAADGYDVVRRLRRRRHRQRGRQRPRRHRHRAHLPARRQQQRRRQAARDPDRRRRRHRAPAGPRRRVGAARRRPRARSTAATSRSPPAWAWTRAWSSAWTATRRLKKRFGPFYFVECAITTFLRKLRRQPAAARGRGRRAHGRRRQPVHAERRELHLLQRPRGAAGGGRALRLRLPRRRRAHPRAALRRPDGHVPRAVGRGPDRQAQGRRRVRRASARRSCAPPTAARSRSRSTATTSTT